ncbi:MAG: tRNA pseudouridine(55) synthase TruB, partial [Kordiimonas sp.]
GHSAPAAEYVLPVVTALDDIAAFAITEMEVWDIKYGRSIQSSKAKQGTLVLMAGDMPVAIAEAEDGVIRPLRVFNM